MKLVYTASFVVIAFLICTVSCEDQSPVASSLQERKEYIYSLQKNQFEEAIERRNRSIAKLRELGIPFSKGQPALPPASNVHLREKHQILQRSYALAAVCKKAAGASSSEQTGFMGSLNVRKFLSPVEREFIDNPSPTSAEIIDFSWRNESLLVLFWSLGFIHDLPYPNSQSNMDLVYRIFQYSYPGQLESKAHLRTKEEILDRADLVYRMHWAATESRLNPDFPKIDLDERVLFQWHYAFNWLIHYMDEPWDNVSTDT